MVKSKKKRWVANHHKRPWGGSATLGGPHSGPVRPIGGGAVTPRANVGGQNHPQRATTRFSGGGACCGWSTTYLIYLFIFYPS